MPALLPCVLWMARGLASGQSPAGPGSTHVDGMHLNTNLPDPVKTTSSRGEKALTYVVFSYSCVLKQAICLPPRQRLAVCTRLPSQRHAANDCSVP